jgi:hypothetical protein
MTKISGYPGGNAAGMKPANGGSPEGRQKAGSFSKAIQNSKAHDGCGASGDTPSAASGAGKAGMQTDQAVPAPAGRGSVVYETTKLMDIREFASLNNSLQSGYAGLAGNAGNQELPMVAIVKSNAVGKGRESAQVIGNTIFVSVPAGQPGQKAEVSDELSHQVLSLAQSCLNLKH